MIEPDAAGRPAFQLVAGSERKSTGSFYTPPDLVAELVKSALTPVLEERLKPCVTRTERERAVLSLRVCDPACGSGHFLLAAARRLGKELARIRTDEDEPAPERVREAIRDVAAHSIYGVDRNPLAVDLCRVALWIESHDPEKPLTFLDHRIRCGDSLIGVFDLDVLADGISDAAFTPLTDDDAQVARLLKAQNRDERQDGQYRLPWDSAASVTGFADVALQIDAIADDSPEAIRRKRTLFEHRHDDPARQRQYLVCHLPIIDAAVRGVDEPDGLSALVVYPMNALVNSQLLALEKLRQQYEHRTGQSFPVTFARYTGDTSAEERDAIRRQPPHVLLTNYVMAELMLVRFEDQPILDSTASGLHFLVFDELHTYRGRQGADVAMLIRRLKERAAGPELIHVGTSATMVASHDASPRERKKTVAQFAERLFGSEFAADQVVEETLEPSTTGEVSSPEKLRAALDRPVPSSAEQFLRDPLAAWIEASFGVEPEEGGWRRRAPDTLQASAERLAEVTGRPAPDCIGRLRASLSQGSALFQEDESAPVFAFKLHQFIGQGRDLFATLEPVDRRELSLDGQVRASGGRILAPIKFCRRCGQDYYHLLRGETQFQPHPIGGALAEDDRQPGYLMLAPLKDDWNEDRIPAEWRDARGRVKPTWRRHPTSCLPSPTTGRTHLSRRDTLTTSCTSACCGRRSMRPSSKPVNSLSIGSPTPWSPGAGWSCATSPATRSCVRIPAPRGMSGRLSPM